MSLCLSLFPSPCRAAAAAGIRDCMREAEALKKDGGPAAVEKQLGACEAAAPRDPRIKMERAGYMVRLGRYEEAIAAYQRAAGLLRGKKELAAVCRRKTAELYAKLGEPARAEALYKEALQLNEKDTEAAMSLAAAYEASSDLKQAERYYALALKYDPANARADERLDAIRFSLMSGPQLLKELRYRGAGYGKKTAPSGEDMLLLNTMRLAERNGAVDYLHSKVRSLEGLAVERVSGNRVSLLLTEAGLKTYQNFLSRDAVLFFETKGIPLNHVFTLRDLAGEPVFDKKGRLTLEGMKAYWLGLTGAKSWLRTYETVVKEPEDEKLNADVKSLLKDNYIEISEPEYLWLLRATTCPEDVLNDPATCKMRILRTTRTRRYFLFRQDDFPGCNQALNNYVEDYRAGETDISFTTRGTDFFGSGGNEKHRLCEKGELWL